jgi:hypothetical protein
MMERKNSSPAYRHAGSAPPDPPPPNLPPAATRRDAPFVAVESSLEESNVEEQPYIETSRPALLVAGLLPIAVLRARRQSAPLNLANAKLLMMFGKL